MENRELSNGEHSFEKAWELIQETDRLLKEQVVENKERSEETDRRMRETDRQIKELGKQIGGLGNKFGSFNEALFIPSVIRILEERFACGNSTSRYRFKDNGNSFEIDVIGFNDDSCYIVEIKSHLREEAITQLENIIEKMQGRNLMYGVDKKLGVIVAADYSDETMQKVLKAGFYFIGINDEIAQLHIPDGFVPRIWENN